MKLDKIDDQTKVSIIRETVTLSKPHHQKEAFQNLNFLMEVNEFKP